MKKRDLSDAQLKASADRCNGCLGANGPKACEAIKAQGACPKLNGGKFPPTWGQLRRREGEQPKLDQRTKDFIQFFESHGATFIDGETGRKLSPDSNERKGSEMSAERGASPRPACASFRVPLRTVSGLNVREHFMVRKKRVTHERAIIAFALRVVKLPPLPARVSFVRIGPRELDSDNLQAALKGVRDEIAKTYGVNDRSKLYSWEYAQRRGGKKEWAVEIRIEQEEKER